MQEKLLYEGKFLDLLIDEKNNQSIRGIQNPHIYALARFLYTDFDLISLANLRKYALRSEGDNDILLFYYAFVTILLRKTYPFLDVPDFNTIIKFRNKDYKLAINLLEKFINTPSKKNLLKFMNVKIDNSLSIFISYLCFQYSDISLDDSFDFYPSLTKIFTVNNDNKIEVSINDLQSAIPEYGYLIQVFFTKYHSNFITSALKDTLDIFISSNTYTLFILHLYFKNSIGNNLTNDVNNIFKSNFIALDAKNAQALLHYLLLLYHFNNDFDLLTQSIKEVVSKNLDISETHINFEWDLDDKNEFQIVNLCLHKNARDYLNMLFSINKYRNDNSDLFSDVKPQKTLSVIGGNQALSWANISVTNFKINAHFLYSDFYDYQKSCFDNNLLTKLNNEDDNINIIVLDVFLFLKLLDDDKKYKSIDKENLNDYLTNIFSGINGNVLKKLFITTIPYPTNDTYINFECTNIPDLIDDINILITTLSNDIGFNVVDINGYLTKDTKFNDKSNFIDNYLVKPDILIKLINKEIINK
tara:strand:+ start:4291 stop:5877 length:1587 start_codon:yes stop_codon:yes gene_type:complete